MVDTRLSLLPVLELQVLRVGDDIVVQRKTGNSTIELKRGKIAEIDSKLVDIKT